MWGADRKLRPEGHCLASRGFAGIFYPHLALMFDSFSCIPFDFEYFIHFHTQWRWRKTFLNLASLWCCNDINLTTKLRDVLYTNTNRIDVKTFCFYPTHWWDNMDEIQISISSENRGLKYTGFYILSVGKWCVLISHNLIICNFTFLRYEIAYLIFKWADLFYGMKVSDTVNKGTLDLQQKRDWSKNYLRISVEYRK